MIVYGRRTSSNVQKVIWTLDELGREFSLKEVGGTFGQSNDAWYLALNPNSQIPTIDDNGFILWESHAILRYLVRTNGNARLLPGGPRGVALADQWLDWVGQSVNPYMKPVFLGLVRTSAERRDIAAIEEANRHLTRLWTILDRNLEGRQFVLGNDFSVADIPAAIQAYRWLNLVPEHARLPNLERWMAEVRKRPAFKVNVEGPLG